MRGLPGPVFENTAASVGERNISLAQHHATDLAGFLNVCFTVCASRDLKSWQKHDSEGGAEGGGASSVAQAQWGEEGSLCLWRAEDCG